MPSLAKSPPAPILGRRVPLRGPARMLFRSYARTCYQPGMCVERLTTKSGDVFDAMRYGFDMRSWAKSRSTHTARLMPLCSDRAAAGSVGSALRPTFAAESGGRFVTLAHGFVPSTARARTGFGVSHW